MNFDFNDSLDPMSPFFQDEFIFNEEGEPKRRRNDRSASGYDSPYPDDDRDEDDRVD